MVSLLKDEGFANNRRTTAQMIQKKRSTFFKASLLAALTTLSAIACAPPDPVSNPVDPVLEAHRGFTQGRLQEMAKNFDYHGVLAQQLGEIWVRAKAADRQRAVEQLHRMMLSTTKHLWAHVDEDVPLVTRVHRVSDDEAWVLVHPEKPPPSIRNQSGFEWRYRVIRKDGVWSIRQREYRVGNQHSNTRRFYPTIIRHLRGEYGRDPTLSELVANLPSLQRRTRVKTFSVPTKSELKRAPRQP